jgi:hypothetical protein
LLASLRRANRTLSEANYLKIIADDFNKAYGAFGLVAQRLLIREPECSSSLRHL